MARFFLSGFSIVNPAAEIAQTAGLDWMVEQVEAANAEPSLAKLLRRVGAKPPQVHTRYSDLPLAAEIDRVARGGDDQDAMGAFALTAGLERRMAAFNDVTKRRVRELYAGTDAVPDHLIHVTCTGYVAPSPVQALILEKGWEGAVESTHAYHMGCYASLPACRMAEGFACLLQARKAQPVDQPRIDVVHTEFCTLHFDPKLTTAEQFVAQSLFADGYIRYSIAAKPSRRALQLIGLKETLIPETAELMTWMPSSRTFLMHLDREIPSRLGGPLKRLCGEFLQAAGVDDRSDIIFAIHPGGPRVIEQVAASLALRPDQYADAAAVLAERGNMSSATLPHIWSRILADESVSEGRLVLSLAFGPGLTVFMGLFRVCHG